MRLLLVAPPGAGKGTQAEKLAAHYGIAHLSSGDLLRKEVAEGTEIGRAAAAYLERGDLVPDDLVIAMLLRAGAGGQPGTAATSSTASRGSLPQAEEAYRMAQQTEGIELQAVIHLQVGRDELRRRLMARAEQEGRGDDNEATIAHRLDVYESETRPLLAFYAGRGLLVDIDGEQPVDQVFADIVAAIDGLLEGPALGRTGGSGEPSLASARRPVSDQVPGARPSAPRPLRRRPPHTTGPGPPCRRARPRST